MAKGRRKGRRGSRLRRTGVLTVTVFAALAVGYLAWLNHKVGRFLAERSMPPLRIFSDTLVLRPGLRPEGLRLENRLRRLGYVAAEGGSLEPGRYRASSDRFEVGLRAFVDTAGAHPARPVALYLDDGAIRSIRALNDGRRLAEARLEPELLGSYAGGVLGERRTARLESLPPHVIQAVFAIEDARFARHPGIDPVGVLRAVWVNVRGGGIRQGGSTITQQLAKNLFLSPSRTWIRKANEVVLAVLLEIWLTKEEILELYLDNVYLGRSGSVGIYGITQASRAFFGKAPHELTLAEAATIAGVIHAPNTDSPLRHPERAKARRDQVLQLMLENGWIDGKELVDAREKAIRVRNDLSLPREAPFFVDEALRRVRRMGYDPETVRGLSVYTTVDLEVQHAAERVLAAELQALEKRYTRLRRADEPLEGAVVAIDADTGFVRAMVGGRDFTRSQFNRVTRSKRQPGSAFKPFVYLAALDDPDAGITPSTLLADEPLRLRVGPNEWMPTNYDNQYLGDVTVRTAIEGSRNVPTVVLARRIGLARVASLARLTGLRSGPVVPAMVLGASEVSLLNLAAAYTVFPNQGEVVRPALIRGVVADDGNLLYGDRLRRMRVATAQAGYVTSQLLEGVVNSGTGAAVRRLGITEAVAGKTGTTNDAKDAWFIGYSPESVVGVWVGFDDGTPVGLTGSVAALPVWVSVIRDVLATSEERRFEVPPGVVFRDVDRGSGMLASWSCPDAVHEAFIAGTEPLETCEGRWVARTEGGWPEERRWPEEHRRPERHPGSGTLGDDGRRDPEGEEGLGDLLKRWLGG